MENKEILIQLDKPTEIAEKLQQSIIEFLYNNKGRANRESLKEHIITIVEDPIARPIIVSFEIDNTGNLINFTKDTHEPF
ncbi:hypothetical protein [Arcobacter sp.]|uniref:hypothetical protein n=1 Tax=unclassified Arcobacter TaxID=2593671 RepID=UPI003B00D9E8